MKTIHKFTLPQSDGSHTVQVMGFHRWLAVGEQAGQLVAWAEMDTGGPYIEWRELFIAWTGQPKPDTDEMIYLGSAQVGQLVHHVYVDPFRRAASPTGQGAEP